MRLAACYARFREGQMSLPVAEFADLAILLALEEVVGKRLQKRDDRILLLVGQA